MAIDKSQIIDQIVKALVGFFSKEDKVPMIGVSIPLDKEEESKSTPITDWLSPDSKITEHFTVADACMLHSYNRLANEMDGLNDNGKAKLAILCGMMEDVRTLLGCPVNVHCMYRSMAYNQVQNIHPAADVHSMFLACDFDCNPHMTIDQVKAKLEPELEKMGIRMEKGTTTWVHVDLRAPGPSGRYFTA